MQTRLIVNRRGELDDIVLSIKVERIDLAFSTEVYVSERGLQGDVDSFTRFLENALQQDGERHFNLVFGYNAENSPRVIVCGDVLASGNVRIRVDLWTLVEGAQTGILDHCTLHFATDIASLDAFDLALQAMARGETETAALAGFEWWAC